MSAIFHWLIRERLWRFISVESHKPHKKQIILSDLDSVDFAAGYLSDLNRLRSVFFAQGTNEYCRLDQLPEDGDEEKQGLSTAHSSNHGIDDMYRL